MPPESDADVVPTYVLDALAFAMSTAPVDQQIKHKSVLAAVANGRRVKNALARLPVDAKAVERVDCAIVTRILNCISVSYHEHGYGSKADAVIFGSLADSTPAGNWIGRDAKPTYYAYLGTVAELNRIVAWNAVPRPKPWSELIQVADHRRIRKGKSTEDQLEPLLSALKSYRPDLPIVHSFTIGHGILELGSLTVCGTSVCPEVPWTDLNSWVAHVALLYDTHRPRDGGYDPRKQPDRDLQYCSAQREFPRWDVRDEAGKGIAVTPFYASEPPGRSTFACFDVLPLPKDDRCTDPASLAAMADAFNSGAVQGFWKLSWQPPSTQPTELELLSELHQNGWVPGLVRPFDLMRTKKEAPKTNEPDGQTDVEMTAASKPDGPQKALPVDTAVQSKLDARIKEQADGAIYHPSVKPDSVGDNIGRVKDVLHLGSIGQPLSQCKTAGDLLKVMYDLIEVHDHLCELGVLHRDISWFNVMCNPKHLIKLHPLLKENKVLPRPCINQILGEGDPEPCVLLADLDHGIKLDGSATRHLGEKTGTPMFISVEVSDPDSLKYGTAILAPLRAFLLAAEKDADAFKRAFPHGDGTFMSGFELVLQHELVRAHTTMDFIQPPPTRHNARHDAESIYWLFLWAFARARPVGAVTPEQNLGTFEQFCTVMFSHSIGGKTGEARRAPWVYSSSQIADLFHPLLQPFELLFKCLAKYLSVPWFLYCGGGGTGPNGEPILDIMQPNHVHVAFRRLTLAFMLDPANTAALATLLDTQAPRYTRAFEKPWWYRRPATPEPSDLDTEADDSLLGKRKAGATRILPARKCKRVPGRATAGGNPDPANDELGNAVAQDNSPQAAGAAAPPQGGSADSRPQYVASEHQHSEAAMALRLMFWKDRELWFGAGVKPDANPQTQAAA